MAERALFFFNNTYIMGLVAVSSHSIVPLLFPALYRHSKHHWNKAIHSLVFQALKIISDLNPPLYDDCLAKYKVGVLLCCRIC